MDDIDVIVPEDKHRASVEALTAVGWKTVHGRLGEHYDTYLVHPDVPDLPLELHWELATWRERPNSVRAMTLWDRRRPAVLAGVDTTIVPPEVELVALAAHAGKPFHHFSRLMWSVDIAVVINAAGLELDWDEVAALTRKFRCRTVVSVALHHAQRLGTTVPEQLLWLPRNRVRRSLLDPVLDPAWPMQIPDNDTARRLGYALADSRARHAEMLIGEITKGASPRNLPTRAWTTARGATRRWRSTPRPKGSND
jgi:hypothetical protein